MALCNYYPLPCPLIGFLPLRRGREFWPWPIEVNLGALGSCSRLSPALPPLLFTAMSLFY